MYIFVVKKNCGDSGLCPLLLLIRNYLKSYGQNDFLLINPGYVSHKKTTLDLFINEFPTALQNKNHCYFSTGMNGKINAHPLAITSQDYLNSFYGNHTCKATFSKDHSKTIAFFDGNNVKNNQDVETIIKTNKLKALAIGSSNLSYETYMKTATKGECDVLMVDDSILDDNSAVALVEQLELNGSKQIDVSKTLTKGNQLIDYLTKFLC